MTSVVWWCCCPMVCLGSRVRSVFDGTTGEVEVFKGVEHRKERPGAYDVWNELGPNVFKVAADDAVRNRHSGICVPERIRGQPGECARQCVRENGVEEKGGNCTSARVMMATRNYFACVVAADGRAVA